MEHQAGEARRRTGRRTHPEGHTWFLPSTHPEPAVARRFGSPTGTVGNRFCFYRWGSTAEATCGCPPRPRGRHARGSAPGTGGRQTPSSWDSPVYSEACSSSGAASVPENRLGRNQGGLFPTEVFLFPIYLLLWKQSMPQVNWRNVRTTRTSTHRHRGTRFHLGRRACYCASPFLAQ